MELKNVVEKIRNWEIAIKNDNDIATIECVKYCFPKDKVVPVGNSMFYFSGSQRGYWIGCFSTGLPSINATELLKMIEEEGKVNKIENTLSGISEKTKESCDIIQRMY